MILYIIAVFGFPLGVFRLFFFFVSFTIVVKTQLFVACMFSNSNLSLHGLQKKVEANNYNYIHVPSLAAS